MIYALGGGWGHLTRAVACALRSQNQPRILTNSSYAAQVHRACPDIDIVSLGSDGKQEAAAIVAAHTGPLIVDTFPRGLGGELADVLPRLSKRKTLIHRDLNPAYVARVHLREFVAGNYDEVLVPGEFENDVFGGTAIPPLIMPIPTPAPRTGVLVCASGFPAELAWYGDVMRQLCIAGIPCTSVAAECPPGCPPEHWVQHWPAIDLINGASVVIGGGGYHTVYECRACGVPLIARPWPRKYDRQLRRATLAGATIVETSEQAVTSAVSRIDRGPL